MPLPSPPLLRNGRAVLLLVAVACLTPDRARAGCDHPGNAFKSNLLAVAPVPVEPADPPDPPAPCPCRGPGCSGQPDRDVPPAAPVPPPVQDATLTAPAAPTAAARPAYARDRFSPRPVTRPASVFHPPRHV